MINPDKDFRAHLYYFIDKLKKGNNFAYSRFSDGELRIMQNKELKLASDHNIIGSEQQRAFYHEEDHKHFDPTEHSFYRDKLMDAYTFLNKEYHVGLSCRCCVGASDFQQMLDWYKGDPSSPNLTWANLFLNGNYPIFMSSLVPLFRSRDIVYIVNENANLANLPFSVKKSFRVGKNCIINDYPLIKEIKEWIEDENITNNLFLFSASSLSNFMIHQLFEEFPENTYLDIGTTLNPHLGMKALRGYHNSGNYSNQICVW